MKITTYISMACCLSLLHLAVPAVSAAQERPTLPSISLPAPDKTAGMPLMKVLAERKANRSFSKKAISEQTLSDLLWATWGVNRPDGRRTAPTARNNQQVEVYIVLESGVWRYDGTKHQLHSVLQGDRRSKVGGAPAILLFAAPAEDKWGGMHVGALYQNAGLYCASVGLACVVKAAGTDAFTSAQLMLPHGYKVYITQSVGWPQE